MIIVEFLKVIVTTVVELVPALLGAAFTVKDSVDSVNDEMLAAAIGVPALVISIIGIVILMIGIGIKIYSWVSK